MPPLTIEQVPLDQLFLSPSNPRHNDAAVPPVVASIRRFGWRQPIVAKRSGEVIAGNTRLKAAQELECETVPVHWFEGDDLEATAFSIADNRTSEFAEWDEPALARLLKELQEEDALDGVGYSGEELDALLAEFGEGGFGVGGGGAVEDPGPEEPPEQPVTQPGDLWILGDHRLLCGDSTRPEDIQRLLKGEHASLLSTDPPYCVDYTGADRPENSGKDWSEKYNEVDIKDLGDFLRALFRAVLPWLKEDAGIYVWHAHLQYPVIAEVFEEFEILCHQPIIWAKPSSTFTYSFYRWSHEPCLFGWRRGHKPPHYFEAKLTTVWEVDWEGKARIVGNEHPTQKPTRLFEIPMEQHTKPGAVVLEPFSGSGSQLIAAEKLGRKCRAMELSPAFVDVAIRRWQQATGKSAVLSGTEETFDERSPADPPDAFEFYFANRSYQAVADEYGVTKRAVTKHAQKDGWQTRVSDREAKAREAAEKKAIETLEAMNDRHLRSLRAIQGKALEALRSLDLGSAMEAVRALDLSIKQERVIRGEPADRTALSVEDQIRTEYQRWLVEESETADED